MYRLAIREQDHAQVAIFHLGNQCPASNPTIGLDMLMNGSANCAFNPLVADHNSVCAQADCCEICGELHDCNSAFLPRHSTNRPNTEYRRQVDERTLVPGASVAAIALEHRLNTNLLFKWRHDRWHYAPGADPGPGVVHHRFAVTGSSISSAALMRATLDAIGRKWQSTEKRTWRSHSPGTRGQVAFIERWPGFCHK